MSRPHHSGLCGRIRIRLEVRWWGRRVGREGGGASPPVDELQAEGAHLGVLSSDMEHWGQVWWTGRDTDRLLG
jgi:hypothetical protein